MRTVWLALVVLIACGGDKPVPIPPGAVIAPPDAPKKTSVMKAPAPIPDAGPPVEAPPPVTASFIDIGKDKVRIDHVACETRALFVVKGKATADKDTLAGGDALVTHGKGGYDLGGDGLGVLAVVQPPTCDAGAIAPLTKKIIRGKDVPELRWANGAMRAHLDVEGGSAYMGRLEGTAAVAEHAHDGSWEVLCAVEAQGTFTLAGTPQKLGPKTCVKVPPKTPHAWAPDANSKLVAIQLYAPPGPEQRFKVLAAEAKSQGVGALKTDAGADVGRIGF